MFEIGLQGKIRMRKRYLIDFVKSIKLYKYYLKSFISYKNIKDSSEREIIVMFDGRLKHGGLSDRLWGMVSIYKYCKDFNIRYKIWFHHPFVLQSYLQPNKVDWIIDKHEIRYDLIYSQPKYISMITARSEEMYKILKKKLNSKKIQQHIYTNTRVINKQNFGSLYHELFRMSDRLKEEFYKEKSKIKGKYVSCTFRFQQLLGDFKEEGYTVLSTNEEKQELIEKCKNVLKLLFENSHCQILVTSDSVTFLESLINIEYVTIIKGEIVHPDYEVNPTQKDVYMKSFIDLYMIANAEKIYLCNIKPLYKSGFPATASCLYNKPYYEILSFNDFKIKLDIF